MFDRITANDKISSETLSRKNKNHVKIDWEFLLESLEDGKVILCLGPGVYSEQDSHRLDRKLASFLREQGEQLKIRVYDDGWLHYLPGAAHLNTWKQVKRFYKQPNEEVEQLLRKVAQIPFHFIINFIPDYKMKEAFESQNFIVDFKSYQKNKPAEQNTMKPSIAQPLVYNLLGVVGERQSIILTYKDFYEYLESIFKKNSMPRVLQDEILNETEYVLFLGLPFDKWYFHLFMRMLYPHDEKQPSTKYAADLFVEDQAKTNCSEQYTMDFVENGVEWFIDKLHKECESREMLRKPNDLPIRKIPYAELKYLVINNKFKKYFNLLLECISTFGTDVEPEEKTILVHQSRWGDIQELNVKGTMTGESLLVQKAKLVGDIIDFIDHLKNKFPDSMS